MPEALAEVLQELHVTAMGRVEAASNVGINPTKISKKIFNFDEFESEIECTTWHLVKGHLQKYR